VTTPSTAVARADNRRTPVQQPVRPNNENIQPGSIREKVMYARELATAGTLPPAYKNSPGDLLLAMSYADALGIPLINAITEVKPIDGKPSASATLIRALVIKAGHKVRSGWARLPEPDSDERRPLHNAPSKLDADLTVAWCEIYRKDDPTFAYRQEWTLRRAEVAQLLRIVDGKVVSKTGSNNKSSNWEKSPIAMLQHRALTSCAREACPEAILGIFTADELGAEVSDDGRVERYVETTEAIDPGPAVIQPVPAEVIEEAESPSQFDAAVARAEEEQDLQTLADLGSVASRDKDQAGVAAAKAAWYRVRDALAAKAAEEERPAASDELAEQAEEETPPNGEE
jgi:RecT family protein